MKNLPLITLAVATAVFASWLATPPTAHADDNDAVFIATLDAGAIVYGEPGPVIELGHAVCADLDAGNSVLREVRDIVHGGGGLFTVDDAAYIVGASTSVYCPRHSVANTGSEAI